MILILEIILDFFSAIDYAYIKERYGGGSKMQIVLLTALGVGGATILGTALGFLFKNITHRFSDIVLSFAAGVMLAAAV